MTNAEFDYKTMSTTVEPSTVFRTILANANEIDRNRMYLVRQIQAIWRLPLEKAMFVGGWHEFGGSYSDTDINDAFRTELGGPS